MRCRFLLSACVWGIPSTLLAAAHIAPEELTFPQKRGAVYDEIRSYQTLGRFAVASDANFFVYEWSRPYAWAPDYRGLAKETATRKQTFIYKVDTSAEPTQYEKPASQYLFYPAAGATYYMGDLSPSASMLAFYELDWDERRIRAGAVPTRGGNAPKIAWFELAPDDARLNEPAVWISNEEFVYPVKFGPTRLAVADLKTGKATLCVACKPNMLLKEKPKALSAMQRSSTVDAVADPNLEGKNTASLPKEANLIATSPNGELSIYSIDTQEKLELLYEKDNYVVTLFQNDRQLRKTFPRHSKESKH